MAELTPTQIKKLKADKAVKSIIINSNQVINK
jgi:hypothetical protein